MKKETLFKLALNGARKTFLTLFVGKAILVAGSLSVGVLTVFNLGKQSIQKTYSPNHRYGVEMSIRRSALKKVKELAAQIDMESHSYLFWSVNIPDAGHDNFLPVARRLSSGVKPEILSEDFLEVADIDKASLSEPYAAISERFNCDWWALKDLPLSLYLNTFQRMGGSTIIVCPLYLSAESTAPVGFTLAIISDVGATAQQLSMAEVIQQKIVKEGLGGTL